MIPADFIPFFSVMAGVGATLFGLVFLVITIKPEITSTKHVSVMRQAQVASSYSALLNPLVISLLALVPHTNIGTITLVMSAIGLVNTLIMGVNLFQNHPGWAKALKSLCFLGSSLIIFGFEFFYAVILSRTPSDLATLSNLTTLLVIIYLYGIARAWDLVGVRQFHFREVYTPFVPKKGDSDD